MGRVRFYTENGEQYCTLRVEEDGLYLLSDKVRLHGKREAMPPKKAGPQSVTQRSSEYAKLLPQEGLLQKILEVLDDFETSLKQDAKGMVSVKPAYKKSGYQVGLNYFGEWANFSGETMLSAILQYHAEVLAEE